MNSPRRLAPATWTCVVLLAFAVAAWAQTASAPTTPPPTTAPAKETLPPGITLSAMRRLDGCVKADGWVGLVTFTSTTHPAERHTSDGKTEKVDMQMTGWVIDAVELTPDVQEKFVVDGVFKLGRSIGGKPPTMGKVKHAFTDVPRALAGSSWVFERQMAHPFYPLMDASDRSRTSGGPLHFLAAGAESDTIEKSTLVGPFVADELADVEAVSKLILKPVSHDVPAEGLRAWLADKSPATVLLALGRLQAIKKAEPGDYAQAIVSIKPAYAPDVLIALLNAGHGDADFTDQVNVELKRRLQALDADTRKTLIETMVPILKKQGTPGAESLLGAISPGTK